MFYAKQNVSMIFRSVLSANQPSRRVMPAVLAAFLALAQFSDAEAAKDTYYRWNDSDGKLVVSDRPPQDASMEYEVVSQRSTLVRRVRPGEGAVLPEVNPRPGNQFEQVDTRREQIEIVKKNPESCARARANIETLDSTARIRIRDKETGELRFLSEEEKDVQRQKARDTIRVHCE
ncbi:MAG: DUF4124 domain-containing protein [Pseudomonadota bacterium]